MTITALILSQIDGFAADRESASAKENSDPNLAIPTFSGL